MKNNWQLALLPLEATIQEAICNLNESSFQIVIVLSQEGKLKGTITDGDIRRALLRGLDLHSSIASVINREAFVVTPEIDRELVLCLMKANKIHQIPIVDDHHRVVGLHLWDELASLKTRSNLMVIMAGGLGTRLHPYTQKCPKPLLHVSGRPILEHIIARAKLEGFERFSFAVRYLGQMIEEYFGDGDDWQVRIDYLREEKPLGTAGALSLLSPKPENTLLVSNGDIMTDIRYGDLLNFHLQHNAVATMAVRRYDWQHPFGVVETSGVDITGFEEKPINSTYVNAGVYALEPRALDFLQEAEHCDMPFLFEQLRKKGLRTVVYPIHESWLDIGRPEDFVQAQENQAQRVQEEVI